MTTKNTRLSKYLNKRKNQGTVILCFKILLDHVIENGRDATLTKAEINHAFDLNHKNYGIGTFRSDYLLRQSSSSSSNAVGVKSDNTTFFINPEFLDGLSDSDLIEISTDIQEHFELIVNKQFEFFNEIESYLNRSVDERKLFITNMLLNRETDKKGQAFEVTSFAILKIFYSTRGFELNRFSTVYSNDGGIDFTSQKAVYQVTTSLSLRKFEEDIQKAPLKKRVFVYKKSTISFDKKNFDHELVLDYINSEDLMNHLTYLLNKKPDHNSKMIIREILNEFDREYYIS